MAGHGKRLNEDVLSKWHGMSPEALSPVHAFKAAVALQGLAVWWLRPEVLERAAEYAEAIGRASTAKKWRETPTLPRDRGACWIALVNCWQVPLLQPALPLVLRWARGKRDDLHLPAGLIEMAKAVRQAVKDDAWLAKAGGSDGWGLQAACGEELDLRELDAHWDSAWASLAAGLLLAAAEGTPDPSVWASGSWSADRGIQAVDGVGAKLALARRLGATRFFLPQSQAATKLDDETSCDETPCDEAPRLTRGLLLEASTTPRDALRDYLEWLDIEPGRDASQESRRDRYLRFVDDGRARRYYEANILDDVIERCRLQLPPELREKRPRILATIVSNGYDLAVLAARLLTPDQCLLFHDAEMAPIAGDLTARIEEAAIVGAGGRPCRVVPREFTVESPARLIAAFRAGMDQVMEDWPESQLVVDLTPGKRIMNLALYDAMPAASHAFCIQGGFNACVRRPEPFSEDVSSWPVRRAQGECHAG